MSSGMTETGDRLIDVRKRGPRRTIVVVVFILALAGAAIGVTHPFSSGPTPSTSHGSGVDKSYPIATTTIVRRSLAETTPVSATLGYAGSYTVVDQAQGIVTWLPATGQVIEQGQVLFRVSGGPVVLLYGQIPAYRTLTQGESGTDVAELDADLVALGDATAAQIPSGSATFTAATTQALEKLQATLGVSETGRLELGQAVFLPTSTRVTSVPATLGTDVGAGQTVMTASSTTRLVTVGLDAGMQSEVAAGDRVTITLPDNTTTPGVVSSVGTVATVPSQASSGGTSTPTVTVEVTPTDPAATGTSDQVPVQVSITAASVDHALAVPIDALVALSNTRYALEVVEPSGVHRLVEVHLGIFDDGAGLVQVSGSGLAAGQRVVVSGE